MLKFLNNSKNTFYVSLNDAIDSNYPNYFLFVFINYQTNKYVKFYLTEEVNNNLCIDDSFNKFILDLSINTPLYNSFEGGFYKYQIFQMDNNTSLDETEYVKLLEVGKAYIQNTNKQNTSVYPTHNEEEAYTPNY